MVIIKMRRRELQKKKNEEEVGEEQKGKSPISPGEKEQNQSSGSSIRLRGRKIQVKQPHLPQEQ